MAALVVTHETALDVLKGDIEHKLKDDHE